VCAGLGSAVVAVAVFAVAFDDGCGAASAVRSGERSARSAV